MSREQQENLITAVLWGAVAAMGQYTAMFLSIVGRIHVTFADGPSFAVSPQGVLPLTKDLALQLVWLSTLAFGLIVAWAVYRRPRPGKHTWVVTTILVLLLSVVMGLIEPIWGLVVWMDYAAVTPALLDTPGFLKRLV